MPAQWLYLGSKRFSWYVASIFFSHPVVFTSVQLRPVCVELSSLALLFKGKQTSVKQVYNALTAVQKILDRTDIQAVLDEKLAEYAFFPLTHIFNQAGVLSTSCIESAVACVITLVSRGWKARIAPEMAKQLLILMTLVTGGRAKSMPDPTDEVKVLAFNCMSTVVQQLVHNEAGRDLLNDVGSKSVVDQLVYLLLEAITESASDAVQFAAVQALQEIAAAISDRTMLASLLPRTISSLTKALRISTNSRRTRKVLTAYLNLLDYMLRSVLADQLVFAQDQPEVQKGEEALDEAWAKATAEQIQIALTQVMRLRSHDGQDVRMALAAICFTVLQTCTRSLSGSQSQALDTLVFVAQLDESDILQGKIKYMLNAQPDTNNLLQQKFDAWCRSLPRVMQTNEARPKEHLIRQLSGALSMIGQFSRSSDGIAVQLADSLVDGMVNSQAVATTLTAPAVQNIVAQSPRLDLISTGASTAFQPLFLNKSSDSGVSRSLEHLLRCAGEWGFSSQLAHALLRRFTDATAQDQIVSSWLTLKSLQMQETAPNLDMFLITDEANILNVSRPRLLSNLYAAALPWLIDGDHDLDPNTWQATAIAIECVVMQAQQLEVAYRPELLDSLYPILALLGSSNAPIRDHAITGLNKLAHACQYSSASDMLIDNADYLVNSIGMKLNAFDITPQAPQVLLTMIRLCGARIIPQIDDLIGSMFSALDNFHGYPDIVEALFSVLRVMVDESKKMPQLTISHSMAEPSHARTSASCSSLVDIIDDLRRRKTRRRKFQEEIEAGLPVATPQKPWKDTPQSALSEEVDDEGQELPDEEQSTVATTDKEPSLPKSYKLLLSIAQSTAPHLTSPSPQVRQTLLQLLEEVSPLLAQHENSFLPLINTIWPTVVPRLLAYSSDHSTLERGSNKSETAYNACAAADVIVSLCHGAGNFMSSRIEDVAPDLIMLFKSLTERRKTGERSNRATKTPHEIGGPVVATQETSDMLSPADAAVIPAFRQSTESSSLVTTDTYSTRIQVRAAFIRLFTSFLTYVRLSDDVGDQIFALLLPFANSSKSGFGKSKSDGGDAAYDPNGTNDGSNVYAALQQYNADALWLSISG